MSTVIDKQSMAFAGRVLQNLPENLSGDDMQYWYENPTELQQFLLGLKRNSEQITVDYSLTLEQMISAGRYDWWNHNITSERFPTAGNGKVTLEPKLVHFGSDISTKNAKLKLTKRKLRPATPAELLAYGATYPETQRKFPIVALGLSARIDGLVYFPSLYELDGKRELGLLYVEADWVAYCRFLAFEI